MLRRMRTWLLRVSARPQSRGFALLILGAIVLLAGWWGVTLAIAYTTVGIHFAGAGHETVGDLLLLLISPVLVPVMVASLVVGALAASLAWQLIRAWRTPGVDARSAG